ncbi:MAG: efflux RND transporter periplasmic adaptor subunit [Bacteroidales bacterium]
MRGVFIAVLISILTVSCSNTETIRNKKHVVRTSLARSIVDLDKKSFSFISQTHHTANLSFRVGGVVSNFNVYSGNYFRKGDVIAQIDQRDFILKQERTQSIYHQSKMEYERVKVLYEKNNISASSYDKVYADYIAAKTAYETTTNELSDTKLIAPFNGYIDRVFIDKYQEVKTGESIVTIVNIDTLRIEVSVSQDIALNSRDLKRVNIIFDAIPNSLFLADVIDVSKNTTSNNLSYQLTALIPNKELSLLPGMSGSVIFEEINPRTIITIPQSALSFRPTLGEYVWCVDQGVVSRRIVKSGRLIHNGEVEILEGLTEGSEVVTTGVRFLSNGDSIEVVSSK